MSSGTGPCGEARRCTPETRSSTPWSRPARAWPGRDGGRRHRSAGAPSGSIYHRFRSRHELFVAAWVCTVRRFPVDLRGHSGHDDQVEAIVSTGRLIPGSAAPTQPRAHLDAVPVRQRGVRPPAAPARELAVLNGSVAEHLTAPTRRRYGRVCKRGLTLFALAARDTPYGMVRGQIGGDIPRWMDKAHRRRDACHRRARGPVTARKRTLVVAAERPGGPGRDLFRASRPPRSLAVALFRPRWRMSSPVPVHDSELRGGAWVSDHALPRPPGSWPEENARRPSRPQEAAGSLRKLRGREGSHPCHLNPVCRTCRGP